MHAIELKKIEHVQAMTEREEKQFVKIFFHHAKDTSNQNLHAANRIHDETEWSPQILYKCL